MCVFVCVCVCVCLCVCVCMYVCVASKYKLDIGREDSMPREVDNLFPTSSII